VRLFCPDNIVEPAEVKVEDVSVQQEPGAQGLVLGRGADVPLDR